MVRLLLHSNDSMLQSLLSVTLGSEFRVRVESDREQVKKLLEDAQADVLIQDFDTSDSSLDDVLGFLREVSGTRVPVVVMTDDDRRSTVLELMQHGVFDYFRKPPHLQELRVVVRRAHEHAQLRSELQKTRERLRRISSCCEMIGSSDEMRAVYDLARRVANVNTYVLICGDSGTGKELVARAVHQLSTRAKSPFVAVSCGAIPETLMEAELFGHEKGAFTGAATAREGYLEQAGDGTLFLDEIGELSLQTQVKLLRVLQEKEYCRVGSRKPIPLRARVVFATHRNLAEMVEQGQFRQDLYFRINVLKITLPTLRERPEDIPELAEHFVNVYAKACGKPMLGIEPRALRALMAHSWPGNVRELENVIQRAVVLAEGPDITADSLPELDGTRSAQAEEEDPSASGSFEEQLRDYKVKLACQTVEECNGNKSEAARRLNISRVYLHRLLRLGKGAPA